MLFRQTAGNYREAGEWVTYDQTGAAELSGTEQFRVLFGPCSLSDHGRCVGRWPTVSGFEGYLPDEQCIVKTTIAMRLGPCPVFRTEAGFDAVQINSSQFSGTDCPEGVDLPAGSMIRWSSDSSNEGLGWQLCAAESARTGGFNADDPNRHNEVTCKFRTIWFTDACAVIVIVGHITAAYNGPYMQIALWNEKPAYRHATGGAFLYYFDQGTASETAWQLDDRDQSGLEHPGSENWYRGGFLRRSESSTNGQSP
eukprot:SAG22_NODE_5830_length_946_cov_1.324675_2_plen_253_part_01